MGVIDGTTASLDSLLSVRELIQLVLLGIFALLLQHRVFAHNPSSQRVLLIGITVVLVALPLSFAGNPLQIPLPLDVPSLVRTDLAVPTFFMLLLGIPGVVLAAVLLGDVVHRQYSLLRSQDPVGSRLRASVGEALRELQFTRPVRLVVMGSDGPASGTLFGPVLVLPRTAEEWSDATLRAVLAHECVHIRRRDDLWVLLMRLVVAFYWWMPWLRSLQTRLVEAIEESCDDAAGVLRGDVCYLEGLLDVARRHTRGQGATRRRAGFLGMAWLRDSHLLKRMRRFSANRFLEVDSRGVYWSLLTLVGLSMLLAGIQPVPAIATPSKGETLLNAPGTQRIPLVPYAERFGVEFRVEAIDANASLLARLADTRWVVVPQYPGLALTKHISGDVTIGFHLAADGSVVAPQVLGGSHTLLDRVALDAAAQSRFPAVHTIPILQLEPPQFRAGTGSAQRTRLIYRFRSAADEPARYPEQPSGE
jgi:hypothetical protein